MPVAVPNHLEFREYENWHWWKVFWPNRNKHKYLLNTRKLKVFSENVLACFLQGSTKMCRTNNILSVQNFNYLQQMCLNEFELKLPSFKLKLNTVVPRLFSYIDRNIYIPYDEKVTRKGSNIIKYKRMKFQISSNI